ncbi:MAG: hypothetical protein KC484_09530 [Colwelliaceae bacterium]|nr:hypothetical protein [Colwelliaceae bacterium]
MAFILFWIECLEYAFSMSVYFNKWQNIQVLQIVRLGRNGQVLKQQPNKGDGDT